MKILLLLLFLLIPGLACAEPIYLKCLFPSKIVFEIKVDEDSGTITHSNYSVKGERLRTFNTKGFFSANEVSYQYTEKSQYLPVTETYNINRTTLAISWIWAYEGSDNSSQHGTCKLVEVGKNRKF